MRLALAAAAAATIALGTIGVISMTNDDTADQLDVVATGPERTAPERANRADRPSSSPSATASPSASPTKSPPASPRAEPSKTVPPPAPVPRKPAPRSASPTPEPTADPSAPSCGASYYDTGETTANGEPFDPNGLTAAHKTFAFNTKVRVTNTANGKSVVVRINDRGPFVDGRCLDLARGAFERIASLSSGVITVRYEVL